jgi:hypothetical protein
MGGRPSRKQKERRQEEGSRISRKGGNHEHKGGRRQEAERGKARGGKQNEQETR